MVDSNELAPRKRDKRKKSKDSFGLLITQIIVCCVAILFVLCVKFVGGSVFKETKMTYIFLFEDKTSSDEIIQSISKAFDIDFSDTSSGKSSSNSSKTKKTSKSSQTLPLESETNSQAESSETISQTSQENILGEEDDEAAFVEDYSAVSGKLTNNAAAMNTMLTPVSGRITSPYGYRIHPTTGVFSMHSGLDIGANMNTPISAGQSGTVLSVSYSSSYGNYILIAHTGGLQTLYAHCNSISAKVGDEVQRGQTIAKIGSSGVSTGPHLHFEVRINGTRINPEWVLKKVEQA